MIFRVCTAASTSHQIERTFSFSPRLGKNGNAIQRDEESRLCSTPIHGPNESWKSCIRDPKQPSNTTSNTLYRLIIESEMHVHQLDKNKTSVGSTVRIRINSFRGLKVELNWPPGQQTDHPWPQQTRQLTQTPHCRSVEPSLIPRADYRRKSKKKKKAPKKDCNRLQED